MPGDFLRRKPQLTMGQFHAFRDERPKEEKWELIDGVPMMMPPPTLVHQRIAMNLSFLLKVRLEAAKPKWMVSQESGLLIPGDDKYNPEPDVIVIDAEIEIGQIYAERFYFVAEVLSPNDKKEVLQAKLAYYTAHEHNRAVLFVSQDCVGADQHDRRAGGRWRRSRLEEPEAPLIFTDIGTVGRLGDLYSLTPLDPFAIGAHERCSGR